MFFGSYDNWLSAIFICPYWRKDHAINLNF